MSGNFPQQFGKYYLLNKIALGGMAEIFRAKTVGAEGFEKELVIKRILPHFTEDEAFRSMFIDEARLAARLAHANIVQVFDFDLQDGMYYIAMEYVEGKDLKKIQDTARKAGRRLTPGQIVWIIAESCKGLDYAHKYKHRNEPMHIVHRDVSPHNIMVSYNGEVKIMDFGIAKAASRYTKTRAGTVKGKCAYMSPEQAKGVELDGRSDMFSLAVVAWELLTDKRLFAGETDFETLSNVLKCEVTPPSSINSEVPPELDEIILKALAKEPEDRYASCAALHDALNRFYFTHVKHADEGRLERVMRELFAADLQTLAAMQAQERTTYIVAASNPGMAAASANDLAEAPTMAIPASQVFDNEAKTMAVDAAQMLMQQRATGSSRQVGAQTGSGGFATLPATGTHTGMLPRRSAAVYLLVGLLAAAVALAGVFLWLEYGGNGEAAKGGTASAGTGSKPTSGGEPGGDPDKPAPPVDPKTGTLTVVAVPSEATLFVDGEPLVGGTLADVPIGRTLVVRAEHDGRKAEQSVTMSSVAQTVKLEVPVATQAPPATITIQAPEDVLLRVGTQELGKGTQKFTAKEGDELLVEAWREGAPPFKRRVTVRNDGMSVVIEDSEVPQKKVLTKVTIEVSPADATVTVDGQPAAPTDGKLTLERERGGKVVLEASAKGHRAEKREVELSSAEVAVQLKLRKESSEPAVTGTGYVTINAKPWANVFYKGQSLGPTPVRRRQLPAGPQRFTLEKSGIRKTVTIVVEKDKEVTKLFDMTN